VCADAVTAEWPFRPNPFADDFGKGILSAETEKQESFGGNMLSDNETQGGCRAASVIGLLLCIGALCAVAYFVGEWLAGRGEVAALLVFVVALAWWGEDWPALMAERRQRARKKAAT
jgi:hypothetical protein